MARALSAAFEMLDLQIETTLQTAEDDFAAALPELREFEAELRRFAALLIADLRRSRANGHSIMLRLAFDDEDDLTEQMHNLLQQQGDIP